MNADSLAKVFISDVGNENSKRCIVIKKFCNYFNGSIG
jgi:hypothetical protein